MRINVPFALMVLFFAGCASFRQGEGVFQRMTQTSRIVQVRGEGELGEFCEDLRLSTEVGVVTKDPEETKWVVNKMSSDRVIPLLPKFAWLADVVLIDAREKPLALVRLHADGHRLRIMPCIRKRNGYIVPVTRSSVHDFHTLDSAEAWQFIYERLPAINEGYFSAMRETYKQLEGDQASTNSQFVGESMPLPSPVSFCEEDADKIE